jgi:hypothetical protein
VLDLRFQTAIGNELAIASGLGSRAELSCGVKVDFTREDLEDLITLNGFGGVEDRGRWTIGPRAGLVVALGGNLPRRAILEMELVPLVTPTRGRCLRLRCGSGPTREFLFPPGELTARKVILPVVYPSRGAALRVHFVLPETSAADDFGFADDRRALGVRVDSLRLTTRWHISKSAIHGAKKPGGPAGSRWRDWSDWFRPRSGRKERTFA